MSVRWFFSVADPERVKGVCVCVGGGGHYFIFMGKFKENEVKSAN